MNVPDHDNSLVEVNHSDQCSQGERDSSCANSDVRTPVQGIWLPCTSNLQYKVNNIHKFTWF